MSKTSLKIGFEKEKLIVTENNRAKYYIIKVNQIDKNKKVIKSSTIDKENRSKFRLEDINKSAVKLRIYLKTDNPVENKFAEERFYLYEITRNNNKIKIKRWYSNSGYVKVITWNEDLWKLENKDIDKEVYNEIVDFFLIHSPYIFSNTSNKKPVTRKFINIYDYWGKDCFKLRTFEREYKTYEEHKIIGLYDKKLGFSKREKDLRDKAEERNLYKVNELEEFDLQPRIAMVDSLDNRFCSFLRHIRNALAHGTFLFCKGHFVFQDQKGSNVTGRGVIKVETLLFIKKFIMKKHKDIKN